jgi:Zn-dependent protease with chaperone function
MSESFYPPNPPSVPTDLTRVQTRFRIRAIAVVIGIFLFLLIYLAMVTAAGYFVYFTLVEMPVGRGRYSFLVKIGLIAFSVMLFVFLLKFLFKKQQIHDPFNIRLKENQHPKLFKFIRQLCQDTKAPFPKKVFVNHECNAAVFYNTTILSLFWPVKKNLLIGLGLIDFMNLSEFKAILAHEFGHFSQKSMKLGSYIYMANRIIYDMVYQRDSWDELLTKWKRLDFRLSAFGYLLSFFVWILRHILGLFYMGLNLLHASLSRQMELQADLVAVSVTGSDAIVNALARVEFASQCIQFADQQVQTAADHKLFTKNIFYHREKAAGHLERIDADFVDRFAVKSDSREMFFTQQDNKKLSIFDTHPTHYQREKNAKKRYIAHTVDTRPARLLLENFQQLSEEVTLHLYKVSAFLPDKAALSNPEEVETFITGEVDDLHYDPRYLGIYDNRLIRLSDPDNIESLPQEVNIDANQLEKEYRELYGQGFEEKMKVIRQRHKDMDTVYGILTKENKSKSFAVNNKLYKTNQAEAVYKALLDEDEKEGKWYETFDRKVLLIHYLMAKAVNEEIKAQLMMRYGFHYQLQEAFVKARNIRARVNEVLQKLADMSELEEDTAREFTRIFSNCRLEMGKILEKTNEMSIPTLRNMEKVKSLKHFLMENQLANITVGEWDSVKIEIFIGQVETIIDRMSRLHFKSLAGILELQEQIARAYIG